MAQFSNDDLQKWQVYLADNVAFSEAGAPGPYDASLFLQLTNKPKEDYYPNISKWYDMMASLQYSQLSKLASDYNNPNAAPPGVQKQEAPQFNAPLQPNKPTPKSLVIIEVKVYESACNFLALAHKIYQIQIEGLVWNKQPKILPIAFGLCKLQIGCVFEDDKVMPDDFIELIESWDDYVHSVDIVSFQKI